jgi:hypothetical protein
MIYEVFLAALLGMLIWIPLYKTLISRWVGDHVVKRVENREIDLAYLLDHGGVFDELSERIITRFKQNLLADMGQLSNQSKGIEGSEALGLPADVGIGIETANQLLNMVGMKKPPAMLTVKVAQALGQLVQNNSGSVETDEVGRFFPDRP